MEIRPADIKTDLNQIVDLHLKAFPGFFMTEMGSAFIHKYYQTVLTFPKNISFVVEQNHQILGFIVGFGNPKEFYQFYQNQRWNLISIIFSAALRNPKLLRRILVNFQRVSSYTGNASEVELSSIGVNPSSVGSGIGRSLVQTFLQTARQRGYSSVYLTTDALENERVNQFYVKQGFNLEHTFVSGSRPMNQYRLLIKNL